MGHKHTELEILEIMCKTNFHDKSLEFLDNGRDRKNLYLPWQSQQLIRKKQFFSQSPQRYRKMADETPPANVLHPKLVIGTLPEHTMSKDKNSKKYNFLF